MSHFTQNSDNDEFGNLDLGLMMSESESISDSSPVEVEVEEESCSVEEIMELIEKISNERSEIYRKNDTLRLFYMIKSIHDLFPGMNVSRARSILDCEIQKYLKKKMVNVLVTLLDVDLTTLCVDDRKYLKRHLDNVIFGIWPPPSPPQYELDAIKYIENLRVYFS